MSRSNDQDGDLAFWLIWLVIGLLVAFYSGCAAPGELRKVDIGRCERVQDRVYKVDGTEFKAFRCQRGYLLLEPDSLR